MFESAELGHCISNDVYRRQAPRLRTALLKAQYEVLEQARFPVVVVIGGVDGAGKGETVNLLNEWMDPRHIQTHAFGPPAAEHHGHPRMARYWRTLPPKGRIGLYFGSWYTDPIVDRVFKRSSREQFESAVERVLRFERMLHDEGALILKFWFHLSKKAQRKRLQRLERNALTRWRVSDQDRRHLKHYDQFRKISERMLRATSAAFAPWYVVEGSDANYRSLAAGRTLLAAMRERLDTGVLPPQPADTPPLLAAIDNLRLLDTVDVGQRISRKQYDRALPKQQRRLSLLSRHKRFRDRGVVAVFEGPDAAGKGGAIRRITGALDARFYQVIPIAAPTDEERAQPYLWRFWRRIPRAGRFTLFDRSWYGRVLVERVEGYCSDADWMRAYGEINDFELEMNDAGIIVVKFWLAISGEEQLRRFKAREKVGYKRYKITADDWRNRKKWDRYQQAADDMFDRTSTAHAPWTVVEANNKHFARLKVLDTLCERIEATL